MDRTCTSPQRDGFTLLETLVVMVLIGIVMMIASPSIGGGLQQTRVQQAAAGLQQDLQLAQATAARDRQPVRLTIRADSMLYRLTARSGQVIATRYLGAGSSEFALSNLATNRATVTFFPNGVIDTDNQGLQVTMQAGAKRRRIHMTSAGLIRVEAL